MNANSLIPGPFLPFHILITGNNTVYVITRRRVHYPRDVLRRAQWQNGHVAACFYPVQEHGRDWAVFKFKLDWSS